VPAYPGRPEKMPLNGCSSSSQWWAQLTEKLALITGNQLTRKLASLTLNRETARAISKS